MTLKLFTGLLLLWALWTWAAPANAGLNTACSGGTGANGTQPAPAAAAHFNCLRLFEGWRSANSVDANDTRNFGYNWYTHNGSTQTPPGVTGSCDGGGVACWRFGTIQPTPTTDWKFSVPGQLTLQPVSGTPYVGGAIQFMSCAQIGTTQQLVGTTFGPSYYEEIDKLTPVGSFTEGISEIAWNVGTVMLNGGVGAPWALGEYDLFQDFAPNTDIATSDWQGTGTTTISHVAYGIVESAVGSHATIYIDATRNGGTGVSRFYQGGVEDTSMACTNISASTVPVCGGTPSGTTAGFLDVLNHTSYCLALAGGVVDPLIVGKIQVWTP